MKSIFWTLTGLGLILGMATATATAQADDKPAPKAPYLAPVPDYGHWTVTFKYDGIFFTDDASAKPPAAPDGFPTVIDTIKTGELRGVVFTSADGTSKQFTCQGDWVLSSTPKGPQLSVASPSQRPYTYYSPGFILLDGTTINLTTFKEAGLHDGAMAFHYKSGDVDAWIDPATMLPLAVKVSGVEASYQFLPAPPRPFVIPDDQAALLKKQQEDDQKIHALR